MVNISEIPNKRIKDITGLEVGLLKVRCFDHIDPKTKSAMWLCDCKCGSTKIIASYNLTRKHPTMSCGCLQKEFAKKQILKTIQNNVGKIKGNNYTFLDNMVIGYDSRNFHEFYFDKDDYDVVSKYTWYEEDNGYIATFSTSGEKIYLHRLVLGCVKNDGVIVDHINGKRFDCVKTNLRKADRYINAWNSAGYGKSGIKGVRFRDGKYEAKITYKGQEEYLGRFNKIEDAEEKRVSREIELYPEYRRI